MANTSKTEEFLSNIEENGNPREKEAMDYIQKHKLMELFDSFTAQLLFNRPVDPKVFLRDLTQKLIKSRTVGMDPPSHFDKTNIDSVFNMMDPTKKGVITLEQYRAGLTALGIRNFEQNPVGSEANRISHEIFGREARKGVAAEASTYFEKPNPRHL